MSIRAHDLSRWPLPPAPDGAGVAAAVREKVRLCSPITHAWQVMPIHMEWLVASTERYGFDSIDETLRHLIYLANSENSKVKKLIFKTIRCLHCHVGARADQHRKVKLVASIHTFHWEWLSKVQVGCNIKSVEKVVRIICDFYQSRVNQAYFEGGERASVEKELEIFGQNRESDRSFLGATEKIMTRDASLANEKRATMNVQSKCGSESSPNKTNIVFDDPAACSEEDIVNSIRKCQVGRNSSSFAVAMEETPEETAARRAKEIIVENSAESRKARELIRKTKIATFSG